MDKKLLIIVFSFLLSNSNECFLNDSNIISTRAIYSVGDTLSFEDQTLTYPVCNGNQFYDINDDFSFADLNGNLNGGHYKITIISMNATW